MADQAVEDPEEPIDDEYETEDDVLEIEIDEPLRYHDDELNLVQTFMLHEDGRKALKEIGLNVIENFDRDWEASEDYRRQAAEDWQVFVGDLPEKNWPYENSANVNVPIMLENISRLHARLVGEIFDDWTNVAGYVPTGPDDEEQSEILTLHLNWQLREQIRDFPRQMERALLAQLIHGDVTCHSYWDPVTRTNRHEVLTVDQFVVPFTVVSTEPDYSDLDHHTKILYYTDHQLEDKRGVWENIDEVLEGSTPTWEDEPEMAFATAVNEMSGVGVPDTDGPHRILDYEGWLRLPEQPRDRWCRVIIHYQTRQILSLMIHEEPDWRDQIRLENQQMEAESYQMQMQAYAEQLEARNIEAGVFEEAAATDQIVSPEFREQAMGAAAAIPYPGIPQMPEWMEEPGQAPAPARMVPIHMYSHGVGIENMAGAHGVALGRIQADHNRAANTLASQFVDAATLANAWGLLIHSSVDFDRDFSFQPGSVNKVKGVTPEEMKDGIREIKPGPANPQLMDMMAMIWEKAQSSVQSPNVLSGEPGKSGETFRGISSRIEQATKQLSVHGRKFANTFLRQVLLNNAKLNAIYMDELEIIYITDWRNTMAPPVQPPMPGQPPAPPQSTANAGMLQQRPLAVGRDMYRRNYGVEIRADLRFTSEAQKIQEATEMLTMVTQTPHLANNVAMVWHAIKNLLEARKRYDLIPLLGPAPPPPDTPLGLPPPPPPGAPPQGQPPPQ